VIPFPPTPFPPSTALLLMTCLTVHSPVSCASPMSTSHLRSMYKRALFSLPLFWLVDTHPEDYPVFLALHYLPHTQLYISASPWMRQMPSHLRPEVMLIKHHRTKKPVKIMDPDCAICSQPALAQCECEAKGLDIAVRQAEQRMMTTVFNDIRYVMSCYSSLLRMAEYCILLLLNDTALTQ